MDAQSSGARYEVPEVDMRTLFSLGLLSASAGAYAGKCQIIDPGEIMSTYQLPDAELDRLRSQLGDQTEVVLAHMNEGVFPEGMDELDERMAAHDTLRRFKVKCVATLSDGTTILHVRASKNKHMPDGFRPVEDFWMVFTSAGVE